MPIIRTKYAGTCNICGDFYDCGDQIWWVQGEGCAHASCHEDKETNALSPIKPVQANTVVRFNPPKPQVEAVPENDMEF